MGGETELEARRAVRLIFAGWSPQDRISSRGPLSRLERRRRSRLLLAASRIPRAKARSGAAHPAAAL